MGLNFYRIYLYSSPEDRQLACLVVGWRLVVEVLKGAQLVTICQRFMRTCDDHRPVPATSLAPGFGTML